MLTWHDNGEFSTVANCRRPSTVTLLDVSQEEAKEAKEDSDDGKTAETEKAASEAMWAVVWHLKNWSKDGSSECF